METNLDKRIDETLEIIKQKGHIFEWELNRVSDVFLYLKNQGVILPTDLHRTLAEGDRKWVFNPLYSEPDVWKRYMEEISKKVVGEEGVVHTTFLVCQGRNVINCNKTSYNILLNSKSGSGKDYVKTSVLEIIPTEDWEHKTRISEATLTYWHAGDKEWTWDGKILGLEDVSNSVLNSDVFKVFVSSGSDAVVVKEQRAIELEIKGKPVMLVTSAEASPKKENLRRFSFIQMDESKDQTEEILKRQAEDESMGLTPEYDEFLINAQRHLKPVKVKIPWAKKLLRIFPTNNLIVRTNFKRFFDYIKASAAFHQLQRERDEDGAIKATGVDYEIARISLIKSTTNHLMVPLTHQEKSILKILPSVVREYTDRDGRTFEGIDVATLTGEITWCSEKTLRRRLDKLTDYGLIDKKVVSMGDRIRPPAFYRPANVPEISEIPRWNELLKLNAESSTSIRTHINNKDNKDNTDKEDKPNIAQSRPSGLLCLTEERIV